MLDEGSIMPYMEAMTRYDECLSLQFTNSWNERRVTMGGISFEINEDSIAQATGLCSKGQKWKKTSSISNETTRNKFFQRNEVLVKLCGGFKRQELPKP